MEILQIPIRRRKRTDAEYLIIFKEFVLYSNKLTEEITYMNFCRWSKAKFGVSIGSTIMQAFKRDGKKSSFNDLKQLAGIPYVNHDYTKEEIFPFLEIVFNDNEKKMPSSTKWNSYRNSLSKDEKSKMPHSRTIENKFGGWTNAWAEFYYEYDIRTLNILVSRTPRGRKQGIKLDYLRHYNMERSPVNEQGVVLLFGKLDVELGFTDVYIQEAFPDCKAVYSKFKGKFDKNVNIEFKYSLAKFFDTLREDFIKKKEDKWFNLHVVIYWEKDQKREMTDRYKLLEDRFGARAINLKRHILTMTFISLKEELEKKYIA